MRTDSRCRWRSFQAGVVRGTVGAAVAALGLMGQQAQALAQAAPSEPGPARSGTLQAADASPWRVTGTFRLRVEGIAGQARVGLASDDAQASTRLRVRAERPLGAWTVAVELQDSRSWSLSGDTRSISTGEVNTLEPVQLYLARTWSDPQGGGARLAVAAGRFTLNLGSRRLVAADDYRNTTNGYTGLRAEAVLAGGTTVNLIAVHPQLRLPDDRPALERNQPALDQDSSSQLLYGGLLTGPAVFDGTRFQVTAIRFQERDTRERATRDRELDTLGLRLFREPASGRWDFDAELYLQTGQSSETVRSNAARRPVRSSFLHAELGYSLTTPWPLRLSVEADIASGDAPGGSDTRFDTLFGMRRSELAPSGLYGAVGRANLNSAGARLELGLPGDGELMVAIRQLSLEEARDSFSTSGALDVTGSAGTDAGWQIDTRLRVWLVPSKLRFEINLVYLDKGRFLRTAPNANEAADTAYLSAEFVRAF